VWGTCSYIHSIHSLRISKVGNGVISERWKSDKRTCARLAYIGEEGGKKGEKGCFCYPIKPLKRESLSVQADHMRGRGGEVIGIMRVVWKGPSSPRVKYGYEGGTRRKGRFRKGSRYLDGETPVGRRRKDKRNRLFPVERRKGSMIMWGKN